MERVGGFGGKADQLNAYFTDTGDPDWFNEDLGALPRAVAVRHPRRGRAGSCRAIERVELTVVPGRAATDEPCVDVPARVPSLLAVARDADASSRSRRPIAAQPPQPGPPPTLKLPAIQKRQLSNGLPVWIVELHEVPVVAGRTSSC